MGDILTFRIPGKEIEEKSGFFRTCTADIPHEGFVLSVFNKSKIFHFEEKALTQDYFFKEECPYSPSKEEYIIGAENVMDVLKSHQIEKVVYSRVKSIEFNHQKTEELFKQLCDSYPLTFCYLVSSPLFGTWIGASPETLLTAHGNHGFTMALAGTKSDEKSRNWSEKEVEEHEFVSDFIQEKLEIAKISELERSSRYEVEAGPVTHLRTDFSFYLAGNKPLSIAYRLHPTPAVCGVPTLQSMAMIEVVEHHDRELYAGIIGRTKGEESHFYVNLRCAQITSGKAHLYLGGGYTKESIPEKEWQETENKALTLGNQIKRIQQ
jgi:isochorismate synthase